MRKYLLQLFALLCLLAVQGNAQVPTVQLISPSPGGSASVQRFTISTTGSDQGWTALMINGSYGWPQAYGCNVLVYPGGWVYLGIDNQSSWGNNSKLGDSAYPASITNSQCTLDSAGGSASQSGNVWTFAFTLTFKPAFAGTKYMSLGASTGGGAYNPSPSNLGTWTTTGGTSTPVTSLVSPQAGGTGSSQVFSFSTNYAGSPSGGQTQVGITASNSFNGNNGCWFMGNQNGTAFYLLNDSGSGWMGMNGQGVASNTQCTLSNYSVYVSGTTTTYTFTVTFSSSFSGTRYIWGWSVNGQGQYGPILYGTWTIPAGGSTATGGTGRMQLDLTTTPRTTIDNLNLQTILIPTDRNPQSSVNLYTATADNPSVLHFGDQFAVVIRNAKPNTQVWMFEVDFQPRPYPEPDDITIYPVLPNNGLLGVTNSAGYLMWNGTVSPTGGSHTLHLSVVNASTPPITTVNFDDGSDTPSLNFIGAITFWAADQYNVPTPPVFQ